MRSRPVFALFPVVALLACSPSPHAAMNAAPAPAVRGEELRGAEQIRQVANRLTFGARPADLATVQRMGVNAWVEQQLHPEKISDRVVDSVLDQLEITHKSAWELTADHPLANEFGINGVLPAAKQSNDGAMASASNAAAALRVKETAALGTARTSAVREIATAKLLRATFSERQLLEVMTDFWENHFSVSQAKMANPFALVDYDRVVRAHALGKFRDLLGAVATSPAMLYYLDNFQSIVDSTHPTAIEWRIAQRRAAHPPLGDTSLVHAVSHRRTGINENYARELMELHTLGVDGGYTQNDVREVARCFTGWGIGDIQYGGSFLFQPALHDAGEKVVLGVHLSGGRGVEDGEQVLDILARHPATARFIAKKLVTHFVSDSAPPALVERVAQTYLHTDGDIGEVMRAIILSPEFNSRAAYHAKVKTPFELVASVLRVMNAAPDTTARGAQLVAQLGQPIFGHLTPEGWPDQAAAWMNTGALVNRVNLGVRAGASQLPNIALGKWAPATRLVSLTPAEQVDGVIAALLDSDASAETRTVMAQVAPVPAASAPARKTQHIGELVAVAIGSADFQRR